MGVDRVAVAVVDARDGAGVAVQAARGKGAYGLYQLNRGRAFCAEHDRQIVGQIDVNAQGVRHRDHVVEADGLRNLHITRVVRACGGVGDRLRATVFVVIIMQEPRGRHLQLRGVRHQNGWVHARVDCCGERKNLK